MSAAWITPTLAKVIAATHVGRQVGEAVDSAVGHSNLGQELLKAGAVTDALSYVRRAYELDPQNLTYRTGAHYAPATWRLSRGRRVKPR
jgi:hypothetical protein